MTPEGSPLVSVIIPCFNQAHFLPDALRSVQQQTCPDWECLVIDDGSTDGTAATAERFARIDERIRVVRQANRGLAGARNRGLAGARGRFIQFLDADDIIKPSKIERQLQAVGSLPGLSLAYCDYYASPENDLTSEVTPAYRSPRLRSPHPLAELAERWESELSIPCQCFLFDSRLFSQAGISFDESLPNHEDWDCWMRLFALRPGIAFVGEKLAVYRIHGASLSRNRGRMRGGFLKAVRKQARLLRADPKMRAILERKEAEVLSMYRDEAPMQRACRGFRAAWLPVRIFAGKVARALAPGLVRRLRRPDSPGGAPAGTPAPVPAVSVIVPNFNHARYLALRIESILRQSFADFELIILDDASTDDSIKVIEPFLGDSRVRFFPRTVNSGSPFPQWNRGVALARADLVWIAESDDSADPGLLAALVRPLMDNPLIGLSYCQSIHIDESGRDLGSLRGWTDDLDPWRWRDGFVNNGASECSRFLIWKNTIPNASAVVFRRSAFLGAGGAPTHLRQCGDWLTWARMLQISDVSFDPRPLNRFRSHSGNVRSSTSTAQFHREQCAVQEFILSSVRVSADSRHEVGIRALKSLNRLRREPGGWGRPAEFLRSLAATIPLAIRSPLHCLGALGARAFK